MTDPRLAIPFTELVSRDGARYLMPYLEIDLTLRGKSVRVRALVDSGASVNVMPQSVGLALGAEWDKQPGPIRLTGNLAATESRGLVVFGKVAHFRPVKLAFAWTASDISTLLLGQMNFFTEFNVCFHQHQGIFEISPTSESG